MQKRTRERRARWSDCHPYFIMTGCAILLAVLATFTGCHNSPADDVADAAAVDTSAESGAREVTTIAASRSDAADGSPADISLPDGDAGPDEICRQFVQYLAAGNRTMAEQLLTPAALSVTSAAQLQLEPVAGPSAEYQMGAPRYATSKRKICQVDCRIREELEGQTVESEITWMCRRLKDGWRIAGMMIESAPDQPKDLLSFENEQDVAQIRGSLVDEASAEIRNAAKSDAALRLK